MEQLIYEINHKKYPLVEIPVTNSVKDKFEAETKKYKCIVQGVKEINRGGWFDTPFVIVRVLVPEENIELFNGITYTK